MFSGQKYGPQPTEDSEPPKQSNIKTMLMLEILVFLCISPPGTTASSLDSFVCVTVFCQTFLFVHGFKLNRIDINDQNTVLRSKLDIFLKEMNVRNYKRLDLH